MAYRHMHYTRKLCSCGVFSLRLQASLSQHHAYSKWYDTTLRTLSRNRILLNEKWSEGTKQSLDPFEYTCKYNRRHDNTKIMFVIGCNRWCDVWVMFFLIDRINSIRDEIAKFQIKPLPRGQSPKSSKFNCMNEQHNDQSVSWAYRYQHSQCSLPTKSIKFLY